MIPNGMKEEEFCYQNVSATFLKDETNMIEKNIKKCLLIENINFDDVYINYPIIYRIIERIDQRRDYYMYFHSKKGHITHMSQTKEMALLCYWLIKYKPISFKQHYDECCYFTHKGYSLNDRCVAYLLLGFITGLDKNDETHFSEEEIDSLVYGLANRDISKESLILYVESFVKE